MAGEVVYTVSVMWSEGGEEQRRGGTVTVDADASKAHREEVARRIGVAAEAMLREALGLRKAVA